MFKLIYSITLVSLSSFLIACSDGNDKRTPLSEPPGPYASDELWLCKPGIADDLCLDVDLTTANVFSDTSFEVIDVPAAENPSFDCFYVYPTVDQREEPGNTESLEDTSLILRPLYNQAARFRQLCNLYAPLYHQMTIGSYSLGDAVFESEFFMTALADVDEAFSQYLLESGDRPFVLIGHSQGSHMLIELMQRRFDDDPALRQRLISALLLGPVGRLEVPAGQTTGGSFDNIPLCTAAAETQCIVAYDSLAAGDADSRIGIREFPLPCVNPTLLGGTPNVLANAIFPDNEIPLPDFITTPWAGYPDVHSAVCEPDGFLGIGVVENPPVNPPVPPSVVQAVLGGTLHQADVNYAMGDLLRIVEAQASN